MDNRLMKPRRLPKDESSKLTARGDYIRLYWTYNKRVVLLRVIVSFFYYKCKGISGYMGSGGSVK